MVCLNSEEKKDHHEFELWKDFPKGLKVLLFYKDADFAARTKIKLEKIHYIVSLYSNSDQALHAISAESFHVAIIELVTSDNCIWCFKFLESARSSLPIIVASSDSSLSMMMKCISLGAAEFLQKPLSEEKLSTIWQHVVHKAFNSGDECTYSITKSLKPIKEMVVSMLHLKHDDNIEKGESEIHEKLATPSTPQLENKKSSFDNKEDSEERNNLRSVEKTCNDSTIIPCRVDNKTELDTKKINKCVQAEVSSEEKSDECSSAKEKNDKSAITISKKKKNAYLLNGIKGKRKKTKVDWTPELHKKFVKAVEQLGLDQAIPSKILDLMKVQGLTRHNVASHLQKYRIHKRHIICPKVEQKIWPNNPQDMINMRGFMQRPFLTNPYPPFHQYYYSNVHPRPHCAPWVPPFQPWHHVPPLQDNWHCQSYLGVQADTWGCPVFPPNYGLQYDFPPRSPAMCHVYGVEHLNSSKTFCLDEEVIDKVVKEALAEPLGPLPIGLTPPSTDTVLSELHRLGIHTVPFLPPPLP